MRGGTTGAAVSTLLLPAPVRSGTAALSATEEADFDLNGTTVGNNPTGLPGMHLRSGNPRQNTTATLPTDLLLAPGAVVESVTFSYRYVTGYGKSGTGVGANFTVRVAGAVVYASPHLRDHSADENSTNYSAPVRVDAAGLAVAVRPGGPARVEIAFANNDRNAQLLLPLRFDVVCRDALCTVPAPAPTVTVDASRPTHAVNPLYMGCHSDTGYAHQGRGFSSQLLFGESFEPGPYGPSWPNVLLPAAAGAAASLEGGGLHGQTALRVRHPGGAAGFAGRANRGLGNEGLYLRGGMEYEGFLFVKAAGPVTVHVAVTDYTADPTMPRRPPTAAERGGDGAPPAPLGKVLAEQAIAYPGGNWTRVNFSLTPSAGAGCVGIEPGSDPAVNCSGRAARAAGHACVRCAAQLAVGLRAAGDALIDFVWFQPGEWGRLGGLPVLRDTVDTLRAIGVTAIRQGGSFAGPEYYYWKDWRGPPWARPSAGAAWGASLISSWGPFEMLDMCEEAGFEPVIDTAAQSGGCCDPADMADLVEYCWGNTSTEWGAARARDGHAAPYRLRYVELGNEQYNTQFVDQVAAMEARAASLGRGGELYYIWGGTWDHPWMHDADGDKAEALGMRDHLLADFHVAGGGAVAGSEALFAGNAGWREGSANLETNAGAHTLHRALVEAADLNAFFAQFVPSTGTDATGRIKLRTASFCTERSGHFDDYDQGITFFLPNGSWIQPPGYVHKMVHDSWLPQAVGVNVTGRISVSAQRAADASRVRLLIVNAEKRAVQVGVTLRGMQPRADVEVTTLAAASLDAANPPGRPALVSPVTARAALGPGGALTVAAHSFTVAVFDAADVAGGR